jgi:hypothetical protein
MRSAPHYGTHAVARHEVEPGTPEEDDVMRARERPDMGSPAASGIISNANHEHGTTDHCYGNDMPREDGWHQPKAPPLEILTEYQVPADAEIITELPGVDRWRTSWTADALVAATFPEPRWAVPGLLAEGCNLLAGPPKLGKSWLALNVAVAIASGGRALGKVAVQQGDVLYLALEDTGRRLRQRLLAVLGDDLPPSRLHIELRWESIDNGGAGAINEWLQSHPDARLVIVDVFTKIRSKPSKNVSQYEADYGAMSDLKALADEWGVAFLVIHHTRKQSAEDFLDEVSGTHGLAGAADAVLVLSRGRGNADGKLRVTGRDVEETDYALRFAADIGTWTLLDGTPAEHEASETRREILHVLRDEPGLGPKAIAERVGPEKLDSIKHLVRKMVDDGQLDTDGDGHYFIPHSPHSLHSPESERGEQSERRYR